MNWTKEQQKVIELRNRNILVSAAAGSGKTAVLVERIIEMVTDNEHPVDIDRLLIVTFTNAAAGEMRERIGNAIEKRLLMDKDNLHLQKQMTLIHSAQITTIHSFCLSIIRNYFNEIDLDPGFRIAEEAELRLLKSDVLSQVLEREYDESEGDFVHFVESYASGKSDVALEEMVLRLYDFSMSHPQPKEWLLQTKSAFLVEEIQQLTGSYWMRELLDYTGRRVEGAILDNVRARAICEEGNGPYMYLEALESDHAFLEKLAKCRDYGALEDIIHKAEWKRLSTKKDSTVDVDKRELAKELRNRSKDTVKEIESQFFFQPILESFEDMKKAGPAVGALVSLTLNFAAAFAAQKSEKNMVDFNDLEHFALDILLKDGKPSAVAIELQNFYEEILVDEYQDSNLVQETLIENISREKSGEPNRFMVGDVKQSIYKFRLARPELFIRKYEDYTQEDSRQQKIDLHQNFRSRSSVLSSVNCIFAQIMHRSLGDIEYDENAALYPGADFPVEESGRSGGKTEVLLVDSAAEGVESFGAREIEAEAVATRIKQLREEEYLVFDRGSYRPVAYQDIVILLRSMSGWAEEFVEVLSARGIPAYADTQTGYFSAIEVKTILNMLLILDNPRQDIPLAAVLRSAIGGFTDEELSHIRIHEERFSCAQAQSKESMGENPEGKAVGAKPFHVQKSLYEALVIYQGDGQENSTALCGKIRRFLTQLDEYRQMVPYTSVYDLLRHIYQTTGYYEYVTLLPSGNVRRGNLDMLLQKSLDFEKTSYQGLFHFNRYIEKLHQYDIDFGEAGEGNGRNAVRIMSIHKSKGLEFPIVFVGGMGKQFNQQDARTRLLLHADLGIGPDYIDYEQRTKTPTLVKKVIQKKITLENLAEELRVLYVAMTRAKEKLILSGQVKEAAKKLQAWQRQTNLSFSEISSAGSYFDWIMPCALNNMEEFLIRSMDLTEMIGMELKERLDGETKKELLLSWDSKKYLTEDKKTMIQSWMDYRYPYQSEQVIKSKLSVSELKRRAFSEPEEINEELFAAEEKLPYIPAFRRETKEISGTQLGTLYHRVMERLSFTKTDAISVQEELSRMVAGRQLKKEEAERIELSRLTAFLTSPLGQRMQQAQEKNTLYKEQPFVLGVPASSVYETVESEEMVIVQGIIDAFFEEEDGLVLLDYKTDHIESAEELVNRYRTQLVYYQKALEQITGRRVKEKLVYSFHLSKEIAIE